MTTNREETVSKLQELLSLCKCGVFISVNEHRDYYETVEEFVLSRPSFGGIDVNQEIGQDVWEKMKSSDTCVHVQAYPSTPGGFYENYHYDLSSAIDNVLTAIKLEVKP